MSDKFMNADRMSLTEAPQNADWGRRLSGILAMAGAPMLLLHFIFGAREVGADESGAPSLLALFGVFYIAGWIAGAIGMRRARIYGNGPAAKTVFVVQMILLALALLFSVQEMLGYNFKTGGLFFAICDAAYPLSHLFMLVVGVLTIRAGVWSGWARFAPLMVGLALPLTLAVMAAVSMDAATLVFGALTVAGHGTIGRRLFAQKN
jgi:hypothetical protein